MADSAQTTGVGGLPVNPNPYGASQENLESYNQALKDSATALEQRYANPNWFNVAAGFFKPQLGGFAASLGSASEAMGDWLEKQRANQLPLSQMRAQLAANQITMGQNQAAANKIADYRKGHPGEPVPADVVADALSMSPTSPAAQAEKARIELSQHQQELSNASQQAQLTALNGLLNSGGISKDQYNAEVAAIRSRMNPVSNLPTPSAATAAPSTAGHISPENIGAVESHNTPGAVGPNVPGQGTAKSSMQVMDATATNPGFGVKPAVLTGDPAHDEAERKRVGIDYFNALKGKYGNDTYAAAAYNWGPEKTDKWIQDGADPDKLPANVRDYVGKAYLHNAKGALPAAQPAATTFETSGASGPQAQELAKNQLADINASWKPKVEKIISNDPEVTEKRASDFLRGGTLLQDKNVQDATGQLFKDKGFVAAMQASIAKGLEANVSTPGGGFNTSIAAPIETYLTTKNVDPATRQKLVELNRIIVNDAINDIREGTQALGGGHTSSTEFQSLMNRMATTSDPYKLINQYFATRAVENDKNAKLFDAWVNYSKQPNFALQPHSNFFTSFDYKKTIKEYGDKYRKAQSVAD